MADILFSFEAFDFKGFLTRGTVGENLLIATQEPLMVGARVTIDRQGVADVAAAATSSCNLVGPT